MKFLIKLNYKNNFNFYSSVNYISTFYVIGFVKKKIFLKKTKNGLKIDHRFDSIKKFKNLNFNNQLINIWVKNGLKLNLLKHFNIFLELFKFNILKNFNNWETQPNYAFVLELLDTKYYYYKFENLLKNPLIDLEYIFDLKLKKLNKKLQKKYNKKYDFKIIHINKEKRIRYILKMIYLNTNLYKYNKYSDRIFFNLMGIIFNPKESNIWQKKIDTYKMVFKFLNKDN